MISLGPGSLFWQTYPGPRGGGKRRPMVVISSREAIAGNGRVVAVVCSTEFTKPLKPDEIALPHQAHGQCRTRLKEPTVAVCNWIADYAVADVPEPSGCVSADVLRQIRDAAGIPRAGGAT